MPQPKEQEAPAYTVKWGTTEGVPLVLGDLMHWRTTADRCYLTVGQMNLPVTDGPIPPGSEIFIEPVLRIMLTRDTVEVWAALLAEAARQFKTGPNK